MSRQLLGVAVLSLVLSACSSTPLDRMADETAETASTGQIILPLTASAGSVTYRLTLAQFTITGEALAKRTRVVKPLADAPVHNEALPVGSYSVVLEKGWVLERRDDAEGGAFQAIPAKLVSANPLTFDVKGEVASDALFSFATAAGDVSLGQGSVDIRIGVQDCAAYDGYTAALATLTVDCLGTIDPKSFSVTKDGLLKRNFDSCPLDESRLLPIDQLLSLQQRTTRLPLAKECFGGRYQSYLDKIADSGVTSCPQWKKIRTVNPITADTVAKAIPLLPELPAKENGQTPRVFDLLEENNEYAVFYETPPKEQSARLRQNAGPSVQAVFPGS
jgi:hypothetical protein